MTNPPGPMGGAPGPQGPGWWQANDRRWYPPIAQQPAPAPRKSPPGWLRVGLIVGGVALLLGIGAAVLAPMAANNDTPAFGVDELMDQGVPRDQAECMADGVEGEFGDVDRDVSEAGREELTTMMRILLECQGAPGGVSDCFVEGFVDIVGEDNLRGDQFIESVQSMNVEDHIRLAHLGMECGGLPATVAMCVTDTMVDEFGRDTFESPRLELTPEQESRLQSIVTECATEG